MSVTLIAPLAVLALTGPAIAAIILAIQLNRRSRN
jgi:hypothetical protein